MPCREIERKGRTSRPGGLKAAMRSPATLPALLTATSLAASAATVAAFSPVGSSIAATTRGDWARADVAVDRSRLGATVEASAAAREGLGDKVEDHVGWAAFRGPLGAASASAASLTLGALPANAQQYPSYLMAYFDGDLGRYLAGFGIAAAAVATGAWIPSILTKGARAQSEAEALAATEQPQQQMHEKEESSSEAQNLLGQIKEAGTAGLISYALWELGFWAVSVPVCSFAFYQATGHWPDFADKEDLAKLGAEAFAFVNIARFAVPLRIGLALGTTPWIKANIVDKYLGGGEDDEDDEDDGDAGRNMAERPLAAPYAATATTALLLGVLPHSANAAQPFTTSQLLASSNEGDIGRFIASGIIAAAAIATGVFIGSSGERFAFQEVAQGMVPDGSQAEGLTGAQGVLAQIKEAGTAGIVSYGIVQLGFWGVSIPICSYAFYQATGHWPDFGREDDLAKLGAEAFAFLNIARFAIPLRIGLALGMTPWVKANIVDKYFDRDEDSDPSPNSKPDRSTLLM